MSARAETKTKREPHDAAKTMKERPSWFMDRRKRWPRREPHASENAVATKFRPGLLQTRLRKARFKLWRMTRERKRQGLQARPRRWGASRFPERRAGGSRGCNWIGHGW